ncbi:MAG: hypothetical protein ACYCUM_14225 [Solirubrobacteraceae bacterium]
MVSEGRPQRGLPRTASTRPTLESFGRVETRRPQPGKETGTARQRTLAGVGAPRGLQIEAQTALGAQAQPHVLQLGSVCVDPGTIDAELRGERARVHEPRLTGRRQLAQQLDYTPGDRLDPSRLERRRRRRSDLGS